jgi:phosphopantetheinyl transferase (holo-ACP synthase)
MAGYVGNDVVDLLDPDIAGHCQRPRFVERVCAPDEVARLAAAAAPHRLLWTLFAAKEAAFKVLAKRRPGLAFAPRRFVVDKRLSTVEHAGDVLSLKVEHDEAWVHAIARDGAGEAVWSVERLPEGTHESQGVRGLAVRLAAERLGVDAQRLEVERPADGRYVNDLAPPRLLLDGVSAPADLSLSHDGAWIAAALLPA